MILPRHYITGIIIFTLFIGTGVYWLGLYKAVNPAFANEPEFQQFNNSFNKVTDVNREVGKLQSNIENADVDFGIFGVLNSLIGSSWQVLKLMFSSFGFMDKVFYGLTAVFGIPAFIPGAIILLVTVLLVFAIYSAIFQREI